MDGADATIDRGFAGLTTLAGLLLAVAACGGGGGGSPGLPAGGRSVADPCGVAGVWTVTSIHADTCHGWFTPDDPFEVIVTPELARDGGIIPTVGATFDVATCTLTNEEWLDSVCAGASERTIVVPFRDGTVALPEWGSIGGNSFCECSTTIWRVGALPGRTPPVIPASGLPPRPPACTRFSRSCASKTCRTDGVEHLAEYVCYKPDDPGSSLSGTYCVNEAGANDWLQSVTNTVCMYCVPDCSWIACCDGSSGGAGYPACPPAVATPGPSAPGSCGTTADRIVNVPN